MPVGLKYFQTISYVSTFGIQILTICALIDQLLIAIINLEHNVETYNFEKDRVTFLSAWQSVKTSTRNSWLCTEAMCLKIVFLYKCESLFF